MSGDTITMLSVLLAGSSSSGSAVTLTRCEAAYESWSLLWPTSQMTPNVTSASRAAQLPAFSTDRGRPPAASTSTMSRFTMISGSRPVNVVIGRPW